MNQTTSRSVFLRGLAAAGTVFALCAGMATLLIGQERDRLLARERETLAEAAGAMTQRLEAGLRHWLEDARTLAGTPALVAVAHGASAGAGRELLDALQRRSPEYAWIGIVRPDGVVVTGSAGLLEGVDISHRPIFTGGVGGPFLGDIHTAVLLEGLLRERRPDLGTAPLLFVDAAAPIRGAAGDGVAAIHIDWQWAMQARNATLAAFPGGPDILVRDAAGQVVLGDGPAGDPAGTWLSMQARTGAVAGHPGLGWTVEARSEVAAVLRPLPAIRLRYAIAALFMGLLSLAASWAWQLPGRTALRTRWQR